MQGAVRLRSLYRQTTGFRMIKRFGFLVAVGCAGLALGGCGAASSPTAAAPATPSTTSFGPSLTVPNEGAGVADTVSLGSGKASAGKASGSSSAKHAAKTSSSATGTSSSSAGSSSSKKSSGAGGAGQGSSSSSTGSSSTSSSSSGSSSSGSSGDSEAQTLAAANAKKTPPTIIYRRVIKKVEVKVKVKVRPDVPAGAHLPSKQPQKHMATFITGGGGVACRLGGGAVRCDARSRDWTATKQPKSCRLTWGEGLTVGPAAPAAFACERTRLFGPHLPVITSGYDDELDGATCQIRTFGVTCFDKQDHGFFIARTGYFLF
jgi:hypothetical protein